MLSDYKSIFRKKNLYSSNFFVFVFTDYVVKNVIYTIYRLGGQKMCIYNLWKQHNKLYFLIIYFLYILKNSEAYFVIQCSISLLFEQFFFLLSGFIGIQVQFDGPKKNTVCHLGSSPGVGKLCSPQEPLKK